MTFVHVMELQFHSSVLSSKAVFLIPAIYLCSCISDMLSYGMLAPVDGKSKPMHLIYGDELFRRAGPPEYMSPTALCRVIHKDSSHNAKIEEILKNMMVPARPRE